MFKHMAKPPRGRASPSSRTTPRLFLAPAVFALLSVLLPLPGATENLDARTIVQRAHDAAGGDTWRDARTLILKGEASFFRNGRRDMRADADSYRMWRVLPGYSEDAHTANGMVRFDARRGNTVLCNISFDGENSYDQNGRIDDAAASERWKSNFGFGIIRFALGNGFDLERMADDSVDGHACFFVKVTDPKARTTLFAIDRESYAIRMVGFDTPQGFHHRVYDDFQRRDGLSFTQPRSVRLYYDGLKTADISWLEFEVNPVIDPTVFILGTSEPD